MKRFLPILISMCLVISISTPIHAADPYSFTIKLREWFPGFDTGDTIVGALASGNIFNRDGENVGYVNLSWSHDGMDIEECHGETKLKSLRLVIRFTSGQYKNSRVVLVGPENILDVYAHWDYDSSDPDCNFGCPLIGYENFIDPGAGLPDCSIIGDPDVSLIAQVLDLEVTKKWFGSYGTPFNGAAISGYLDHTPYVSPGISAELIFH